MLENFTHGSGNLASGVPYTNQDDSYACSWPLLCNPEFLPVSKHAMILHTSVPLHLLSLHLEHFHALTSELLFILYNLHKTHYNHDILPRK